MTKNSFVVEVTFKESKQSNLQQEFYRNFKVLKKEETLYFSKKEKDDYLNENMNPPYDTSFENCKYWLKYYPSQRETNLLFKSTTKNFVKYISF